MNYKYNHPHSRFTEDVGKHVFRIRHWHTIAWTNQLPYTSRLTRAWQCMCVCVLGNIDHARFRLFHPWVVNPSVNMDSGWVAWNAVAQAALILSAEFNFENVSLFNCRNVTCSNTFTLCLWLRRGMMWIQIAELCSHFTHTAPAHWAHQLIARCCRWGAGCCL